MKKIVEENFVNKWGQTLKPGERVTAVTSGYGNQINILPAIYLGLVEDGGYWAKDDAMKVAITVLEIETYYENKDGEEIECDWRAFRELTEDVDYFEKKRTRFRRTYLNAGRVFRGNIPEPSIMQK